MSRFTLFVAAWTVTAPFDIDIPPSGTASPETAEETSLPPAYVDHDPDDVPTTVGDGAPAPLAAAVQGRTPPPEEQARPSAPWSGEARNREEATRAGLRTRSQTSRL